MAAEDLPDADALARELVQLSHRQRELLRRHDRLTQRLMAFPTDFGRRQARGLAAEIAALSRRMDSIEAELVPVRRPDRP